MAIPTRRLRSERRSETAPTALRVRQLCLGQGACACDIATSSFLIGDSTTTGVIENARQCRTASSVLTLRRGCGPLLPGKEQTAALSQPVPVLVRRRTVVASTLAALSGALGSTSHNWG